MVNHLLCAVCKQHVDSSTFCSACGANFCDNCWGTQVAHQPGSVGDVRHEKSDPGITKRLRGILTPATDDDTQRQLHMDDSDTTWLRYTRAFPREPELHEYGRYKKLMQDSFTSEWRERWPQLVSFIGQTGDGKSTIIKMLIGSQRITSGLSKDEFPTPVVGGIGTSIPTSADIHIYADPESQYTQFPRLYADCEGLMGGEKVPMANRAMEVDNLIREVKKKVETNLDEAYLRKLREKARGANRRKLGFAYSEETRKREYTVRELYPRLLYTFSHVVVFVLHNERTFESNGFVRLLNWAARLFESATNQSVLPHVIVVLNKSHALLKEEEFDVDTATKKLLSDADQSLELNPDISQHVRYWRDQGRNIRSAKDLINCYYSTIKVVRIPEKGRYMLINQQVKRLQDHIAYCCRGSHEGKIQARRDLNADELGECLQSGLDHFTDTLYEPFDFLAFSWGLNPIPPGFEGNILRLALAIKDFRRFLLGEDLFNHLSNMVASCIMLDYVRHRIKGTPSELLEHYMPVLDSALDKFCDVWWPCSFISARGKRCVNTREGHAKGHQDERGKPLENGEYQSNFIADSYRPTWHRHLQEILLKIEKRMRKKNPMSFPQQQNSEEREAAEIHLKRMNEFYRNLGGAEHFFSNATCLSCLRDMPEHPLPCGHVICSQCVRTFGEARSKTTFHLTSCPLHNKVRERVVIQISLKPHLAGVRVLSLDGGGVRGIVELQVLNEIERKLGGNIRIQDFFDLIVGTSTGGIIALGLGVQNWSVEDCISKFKSLCGDAFTEREFHGVPVLGKLTTANHRSKFKTSPFEKALKDVFGKDLLFGGCQPQHYARHVAVTTTTGVGSEPRILTNYNRPRMENPEYTLERPERYISELGTWQAARATSAAPPYFKSFRPQQSSREFIDGAVYHNNPIKVADAERKYIWPDVDNLDPDILLSIGTGKSSKHLKAEEEKLERQKEGIDWSRWVPKLFKVVFATMNDVLDAERTWQKFFNRVPEGDPSRRYIRINTELSSAPPALDEKDKLWSLETETKRSLSSMNASIRDVADRLVASCFYFEKANVQPVETKIAGQIRCRFEDESENLRYLGTCLMSFQSTSFSPFFTVTEEHLNPDPIDTVEITHGTIHRMVNFATFSVPEPIIYISSQHARTTIALVLRSAGDLEQVPISGFPRQLGYEDEISIARQKTEREAIRRSQSHYQLNSPDAPRSSVSSSGINLFRRNEDNQVRSSSASEPAISSLGSGQPPESADDVAEWVERQQDPSTAELEDTAIARPDRLSLGWLDTGT